MAKLPANFPSSNRSFVSVGINSEMQKSLILRFTGTNGGWWCGFCFIQMNDDGIPQTIARQKPAN